MPNQPQVLDYDILTLYRTDIGKMLKTKYWRFYNEMNAVDMCHEKKDLSLDVTLKQKLII